MPSIPPRTGQLPNLSAPIPNDVSISQDAKQATSNPTTSHPNTLDCNGNLTSSQQCKRTNKNPTNEPNPRLQPTRTTPRLRRRRRRARRSPSRTRANSGHGRRHPHHRPSSTTRTRRTSTTRRRRRRRRRRTRRPASGLRPRRGGRRRLPSRSPAGQVERGVGGSAGVGGAAGDGGFGRGAAAAAVENRADLACAGDVPVGEMGVQFRRRG
jgi:hypothetical protein